MSILIKPSDASAANQAAGNALLNTISQANHAEDTPHVSGDIGALLLGVRSDNETATAADGDYTFLKLDDAGRLKVTVKPSSYPDITGDITAIQATISTPVAGGTVSGDVDKASNIMAFCTGTFNTVNCTFEGSLESSGDSNWFGIQAVRSNANTIETTTGNLSAQPVYSWEMSVNALRRVRVRATARTSGTQSWRFVLGTYATEPIPAAQISGTQPVSGTVTATVTSTRITPNAADGHSSTHHLISAASTNATSVKNSAGAIGLISISNANAAARYFKLYNKASAPTVGTDTPIMTILLKPGETTFIDANSPIRCSTGIAYALTTGITVADTGAVAASEHAVSILYT